MLVDLLLIDRLVFFVALLLVFLGRFGFLLSLVLLTFVSHGFLLRFFDFSVWLRGRILERLLNSPCDEFPSPKILYLWPFCYAAPSILYTPGDTF